MIIEDLETGEFRFSEGAAGGSRIVTANVQTVVSVIDKGYGIQQAINNPRLHNQLVPQVT